MLFENTPNSINHSYFNIITAIYPKIKGNIDNVIFSFKSNVDASKYFVDYFEEGHNEIHLMLGNSIPCEKINELLNDFFRSVIKFEFNNYKNDQYEIPNLFYNYQAVHYFNKIKDLIAELHRNNLSGGQIVNSLIKYEQNRHQNFECECGESHDFLESNQLQKLFIQLLDYYYSICPSNYDNSSIHMISKSQYLN